MTRIIDRIAFCLMTWALRRFYVADCETYIWDDFADEPYGQIGTCLSCEAKHIIEATREFVQ